MPLLSGEPMVDGSGTALEDLSSVAIGEPDLQVVVTSFGMLAQQGGGVDWDDIIGFLDAISDAIETGANLPLGAMVAAVQDNLTHTHGDIGTLQSDMDSAHMKLDDLTTSGTNSLQTVLDAIAALDVSGGLTTEEHDALLALENADYEMIARFVWGQIIAVDTLTFGWGGLSADQVLENICNGLMVQTGWVGIPVPDNPLFAFVADSSSNAKGWLGNYTSPGTFAELPQLDLSTIAEGDTAMSWLTREYPSYEWHNNFPTDTTGGTGCFLVEDAVTPQHGFRLRLTNADIRKLWPVAEDAPVTISGMAPVWPGADNATVGTPEAMSNGMTLTGPFHGLYITITGHPTGAGKYVFGSVNSWMHAGAVTFGTDEGVYERAQTFGLDDQILVPQTMTEAGVAKIRLNSGWSGTVAKWTIDT